MSSSPSPSSSATPPTKVASKKTKKFTKSDLKGKKKQAEPRNEGVGGSNWDYTPPQDACLVDFKEDAGQFDWDTVNNDEDVELCLIRLPEAVKPKHLENLTIDMPSSSRTTCIGTLKRKHMTYDVWALGDNDSQNPVGGDEMKGISCLLPRKKKKGRLYPAPKPIARHLVLSAQPVKPTPLTNNSTSSFTNPQRPSYPKELLKHRFMPYGSLARVSEDENLMDTDAAFDSRMDDAVAQTLKPSISKQQKPYVEITGTPAAKKRKKTVS